MLSPEADKCVPDTQETYYEESANKDTKEKIIHETQNTSLNDFDHSQDFHLMLEDESQKTKLAENKEASQQKSLVEQLDVQQISVASQLKTNDEVIITNDKEIKNNEDKKSTQNKVVEEAEKNKSDENISDDIYDSKEKNELLDEDEIIEGTPPQRYSPKTVSNVDVTGLKRKADSFEEPLAKIPKILSQEDTANAKKHCEEEESQQSCESDNSYEDLFKDIEKNVVIEETQDVDNLEVTQNCLKNHPEQTTANDKIREHQDEQIKQQQSFSEVSDVEKDENLNLSAKITDTSANDSTVVNMNSTIENDSRTEDNNLSLETKEKVIATKAIVNERPEIEMLDEINQSIEEKNTEPISNESDESKKTSQVEVIAEKIADKEDKIPFSQIKTSEVASIAKKSRTSIEVIYDSVNSESRSKIEIDDEVQIEDDGVKIVDLSAEVVEIVDDSHEKIIDDTHEKSADNSYSRNRILESLTKGSEVKTIDQSSLEKTNSDMSYRSTAESAKESSLDSKLMEKRLVNGNTESKCSESTDATLSVESDTYLSGCETPTHNVHEIEKKPSDGGAKGGFKDPDNNELVTISDHETSNTEDKNYMQTKVNDKALLLFEPFILIKCKFTRVDYDTYFTIKFLFVIFLIFRIFHLF